jgi:hypothetical protein
MLMALSVPVREEDWAISPKGIPRRTAARRLNLGMVYYATEKVTR